MRKRELILNKLVAASDLQHELLPRETLIEVLGEGRVLVENHCGVIEYSCNEIRIRTRLGVVCVCGRKLYLAQMTKAQLVITGEVDAVRFFRG